MRLRGLLSILFLSMAIISCDKDEEEVMDTVSENQEENASGEEVEPNDEAINAVITFTEAEYDFGTVNEGELVKHIFEFTNTGNVPVTIESVAADCGCTVPSYTETAVASGEKGFVEVNFDTNNKSNTQVKNVTLKLDAIEGEKILTIKGTVVPN